MVLMGLVLRVWGSSWGLPYLYHPDEDKIVTHALAFGKGDLNPHFFLWPSLQMYIMFFFYGCYFVFGWLLGQFTSAEKFLVAFAVDPSSFYLLGRWLSALLGALTIWLTYAVGRRLYGRNIGLIGAVFLTVNYLHVKDSHYITPDVPVTFMVMAAFWFAVKMAEEPKLKNYVSAGILTGLAVSVKYPAFLIAISLLVAHLTAVRANPKAIRFFSGEARLAAALIPIAFVVGTPYSLLDWNNFLIDLWHQKMQVSYPLPLSERAGTLLFENPLPALGIGIYALFLAGTVRCLFRRSRADVLLLSFPITYIAFMLATSGLQYRYLMPVLPFFSLLAAVFLVDAVTGLTRHAVVPRAYGPALTTVATLALTVQPAAQSIALDLSLSQPDTRTQAKAWIEPNIPAGSHIAVENYGPPLLSALTPLPEAKRPTGSVEEWGEHRDQITEHAAWGRVRNSRLGQEWKKYDALVEEARKSAHQGLPRYVIFKLRPIPYVWQIRLETGQVREHQVDGFPEYRYFFEPERFLSENSIQYVVLSSGTHTSEKMKMNLQQRADLLHRVEKDRPVGWIGELPLYSFHNPTIEIYRLKQ